jgi:hypothetical protein
MSGTAHEIWLARDSGERLAILDGVVRFSYTRVVNNSGHFSLTLTGAFDKTLLAKDRRVLFWRKPAGGAMSLAFVGLIRRVRTSTNGAGLTVRTVSGHDLTGLLRRRVVAYAAASAQAAQEDQADDMLTEIVKDNLGADASAARALSTTYFSVAVSPAAGPSITKGFSYRNVLDVMREIADAARQAGTYLFFGIVPTTDSAFEFRTRTGEWGRDRTS